MISTADDERMVGKCGENGREDIFWLRQSYDRSMIVSSACGRVGFYRVYHGCEGVMNGERMAKFSLLFCLILAVGYDPLFNVYICIYGGEHLILRFGLY